MPGAFVKVIGSRYVPWAHGRVIAIYNTTQVVNTYNLLTDICMLILAETRVEARRGRGREVLDVAQCFFHINCLK